MLSNTERSTHRHLSYKCFFLWVNTVMQTSKNGLREQFLTTDLQKKKREFAYWVSRVSEPWLKTKQQAQTSLTSLNSKTESTFEMNLALSPNPVTQDNFIKECLACTGHLLGEPSENTTKQLNKRYDTQEVSLH